MTIGTSVGSEVREVQRAGLAPVRCGFRRGGTPDAYLIHTLRSAEGFSATSATLIVLTMLLAASLAVANTSSIPAATSANAKASEQPASRSVETESIATPGSEAATPPITTPVRRDSHGGLYTVRDGNKVDAKTLAGWKTWRALACERCHGAAQEGLVGPSLVVSLKTLTKEEFHTTIMNGRLEKGMPPFSSSKMVTENWEGLYAYLKGRSDGRIEPGHLWPLDKK